MKEIFADIDTNFGDGVEIVKATLLPSFVSFPLHLYIFMNNMALGRLNS
jgi:hypothetical protein